MNVLTELGITRKDVIDKAAEKLLEAMDDMADDVLASVRKKATDELGKRATAKIDEILATELANIADAAFTPVDEWGEQTRDTPTTLRALLKERSLKYLSDKVDKDGKPTAWHSAVSRAEWMAEKVAKEAMSSEMKQELDKAVESAKAQLRQQVAAYIAAAILK